MIEYKIITANSTDRLEERITHMLNDGWELEGGISRSIETVKYLQPSLVVEYCQAISKTIVMKFHRTKDHLDDYNE